MELQWILVAKQTDMRDDCEIPKAHALIYCRNCPMIPMSATQNAPRVNLQTDHTIDNSVVALRPYAMLAVNSFIDA